jgi:hypothetical protein
MPLNNHAAVLYYRSRFTITGWLAVSSNAFVRRLLMEAPPPPPPKPHRWISIAAGRVCTECQLAQANGEFDDTVPCTATRALSRA